MREDRYNYDLKSITLSASNLRPFAWERVIFFISIVRCASDCSQQQNRISHNDKDPRSRKDCHVVNPKGGHDNAFNNVSLATTIARHYSRHIMYFFGGNSFFTEEKS